MQCIAGRFSSKSFSLESEVLFICRSFLCALTRLVDLAVKAFTSRAVGPGFDSHLRIFSPGSNHTSHLLIGTPVATLPGTWRHRVSAGTGWPGVSKL